MAACLLLLQTPAQAEPVEFSVVDIDGRTLQLSDYRGKWVLVNYWATWCAPCVKEIPELEAFHNKHKENKAVVLGLNMEQIELGKLRRFLEDKAVTYPVAQVEMAVNTPFGMVLGMPTSFLINPAGEVAARETGIVSAESIENFIERSERQRARVTDDER